MKPHPRIRKAVKWGGLVVSVLLLVVWVGSGWWNVQYDGFSGSRNNLGRSGASVNAGRVFIYNLMGPIDQRIKTGFIADRIDWPISWWFIWRDGPWGWQLFIPLWFPFLLCAGPTALAWRSDILARRRARIGKCVKCNYDRAGLAPDAKCPECGAEAKGSRVPGIKGPSPEGTATPPP